MLGWVHYTVWLKLSHFTLPATVSYLMSRFCFSSCWHFTSFFLFVIMQPLPSPLFNSRHIQSFQTSLSWPKPLRRKTGFSYANCSPSCGFCDFSYSIIIDCFRKNPEVINHYPLALLWSAKFSELQSLVFYSFFHIYEISLLWVLILVGFWLLALLFIVKLCIFCHFTCF